MDEFKPEDELKPDPSDRRTGRSRQSSDRDNEPQINFDDVELEADERRPARSRKAREDVEPEDELYDDEDDVEAEEVVERRPRKRKSPPRKPASRQYIMMGVGILVLLLLIVGIGSALKSPSSSSSDQSASAEKISISPVMLPIRQMALSQRQAPLPQSRPQGLTRSRMFLCRQSLLHRLRVSQPQRLKASSVWKCRAI